jgi:NAD(P)-dependent dehydrogenase (short-subunit alcohol dehydrogenase family)
MGSLAGKVAVVTGAAQGLGFSIAQALAEAGASVLISARSLAKAEAAAKSLSDRGLIVSATRADVKVLQDVEANITEAVDQFGGLDILVNNAQKIYPPQTLEKNNDDQLIEMFESGPLATLRYMRVAYPHFQKRGGGVIINFATGASQRWNMTGYGPYACVKQAIRMLSKTAADEWGRDNIRVVTIAPFAMTTGLQGWIRDHPEDAAALVSSIPARKIGNPVDDVGRAVVLLCQPEAQYITGATIPVDGGMANFD